VNILLFGIIAQRAATEGPYLMSRLILAGPIMIGATRQPDRAPGDNNGH
jgi:hypothetical protein